MRQNLTKEEVEKGEDGGKGKRKRKRKRKDGAGRQLTVEGFRAGPFTSFAGDMDEGLAAGSITPIGGFCKPIAMKVRAILRVRLEALMVSWGMVRRNPAGVDVDIIEQSKSKL